MIKKCIGCGVQLQDKDRDKLGYVSNIENDICERCFKLSHYGEFKSVSLTNADYIDIINSINKNNLVLYVTDILELNLKYIEKFPNVVLVVTKRDVLPKSVNDERIIEYIKKNYKINNVILISSIHNYNIDNLYNLIVSKCMNKEVYVVGTTNSGKSTLINKLIKNYSSKDNFNSNITTSMYPSTTLNKILIKINNLSIIDTPGLINENSLINYVAKDDLKKIISKKEIKPKTCQITKKGSVVIDKYIRIDYETTIPNSIVIYMSNNLNIRFNSLKNDYLKTKTFQEWSLLEKKDLVIPGLGFIKLTKPIKIKIYMPKEVKCYIRENLI